MIDLRFIAFISPALHAKLIAFKPEEPKPTRKTAQQRRAESIMNRLQERLDAILQESASREAAFQERVDAISNDIYHEFQPHERCVLSNEPILTDEQRRVYAFQAGFASGGTASRRKLKREMKKMQRRGVLQS